MQHISPHTQLTAAAPAAAPGARLGWLDALRGIAALVVALHHFDVLRMLPFGGVVWRNFDMGLFGVMLFFIVSGYIIPASLERRGDVRAFWIGRIFRIYPALIAAFVLSIMLLPAGDGSVALLRTGDDLASLIANGLMLQDLLGVINGMNVTWTLCYEMVFYFFVTALFTRGLHRHSAPIAVGLAAVALAVGTAVGTQLVSAGIGSARQLVLIVAPIVLAGLVGVLSGRRTLTGAAALVLAGVGLVLVALNSRATAFETWMIFATMFAGTVVYRAQHGQLARLPALLSCGSVVVAGVVVGPLYNHGEALDRTWSAGWEAWSIAYVAAWALFGIGFLLRERRFPKVLTWLGAISFSVYLLHIPLLRIVEPLVGIPPQPSSALGRILWTATFLGVVMAVSHLMYRLVEMPMQRVGRRVQKAVDRRWPRAVPAATATLATAAATSAPAGADTDEPLSRTSRA
ncbi:acyltransferase family protein [Streptomyces sp. NPDC005533]|uniref:acyltransferase family protein n=1 Tax=Streptomyces sp. NPDC005533 TaxID=3364723 RepID=UPI00369BC6DE